METRDYYDLKEIIMGMRKEYLKGLKDIQMLTSYVKCSSFFDLTVFKTDPFVLLFEKKESHKVSKKAFYSLSFQEKFQVFSNDNWFYITNPDVFQEEVFRVSESEFYKNIESECYETAFDHSYYFHFSSNYFVFFFSKNEELFEKSTWLKYDALTDEVSLNSVYPLLFKPKLSTILNYKIKREIFPSYIQNKLDSNIDGLDLEFHSVSPFPIFESHFEIKTQKQKVLEKRK